MGSTASWTIRGDIPPSKATSSRAFPRPDQRGLTQRVWITATSSGAAVKKGEKIAEVGETGVATGPHLHFELQQDGVYLNPIYYVS